MSGEPLSDLEIALLVRMHGGPGGVRRLFGSRYNFVETAKGPDWTEENGVITLEVTSDGKTGPEWIEWLKKTGYLISERVEKLVCTPGYLVPTTGARTIVKILRRELFIGRSTDLSKIRYFAKTRMACGNASPEVACLLREKLVNMELEIMSLSRIAVVSAVFGDRGEPPTASEFILTIDDRLDGLSMLIGTGQRLDADGYAFTYSPSKS